LPVVEESKAKYIFRAPEYAERTERSRGHHGVEEEQQQAGEGWNESMGFDCLREAGMWITTAKVPRPAEPFVDDVRGGARLDLPPEHNPLKDC